MLSHISGAVAGLADHPIQNLLQTDSEGQEKTSAASGLVTGMGKGLVGVLTKPIGGAAEFVSQTGQGKGPYNGLKDLYWLKSYFFHMSSESFSK